MSQSMEGAASMGYQSYQQPATMGMPMQQQQPFYPSPQYPSGYFRNQTRRQRTHQDTRDREAEVRRLVLGYSSNEENRDSGYYAENVMPKTARPDVLTLRVTEVERSLLTLPPRRSRLPPTLPEPRVEGMRSSITLTAPPMALDP